MSEQVERNSVVIEEWFQSLDWPAKLAACLLLRLRLAESSRLQEIGARVLERLEADVIETEGMTKGQDMNIREMYLLLCE